MLTDPFNYLLFYLDGFIICLFTYLFIHFVFEVRGSNSIYCLERLTLLPPSPKYAPPYQVLYGAGDRTQGPVHAGQASTLPTRPCPPTCLESFFLEFQFSVCNLPWNSLPVCLGYLHRYRFLLNFRSASVLTQTVGNKNIIALSVRRIT